jgi:hypothetical protein
MHYATPTAHFTKGKFAPTLRKLALLQLLRPAYSNLVGKYVIALYTGNHVKPGRKPYYQNEEIQNFKADFLHTVTNVS